ncbi:MAG: hypothetical protein WC802_03735 [Patescibacteria group bacterium]|jgi:hypothetical protein
MRRFTLFIALAVIALSFTFQAVHVFAMTGMANDTGCEHADQCSVSLQADSVDCLQECLGAGLPETFFSQMTPGEIVFVVFSAFVVPFVFLRVNQAIEQNARDAPFGKFDLHRRWASVAIKS